MENISKFKIWFLASRPKTLPAAVAPIIIGLAMAYSDNKSINCLTAVLTLVCAVLIQVGTNFANDYFDFVKGTDNNKRIGPKRATQNGLVSKKEMKFAFLMTFAIAALLGIVLVIKGGWPILIIGILAIIFGILYTAGPMPLAYVGLGDIFVFIFFGIVAVCGTYFLQAFKITLSVFIASLAPGLLSAAILTSNNLRDENNDRLSGKRTVVVRLGYRFGSYEYLFCIIAANIIPFIIIIITKNYFFILLSLISLIFAIKPLRIVLSHPDPLKLMPVLQITAAVLMVYSIFFSIGYNIFL